MSCAAVAFGLAISTNSSNVPPVAPSARNHRSAGVWKSYVEDWAVKATNVPGQLPAADNLGWQRPNIGFLSDPRYTALGETEQFGFPDFFNGRMSAPPTIIVPTKTMVHDKPNAYLKLLEVTVDTIAKGFGQ